MGSISAAEKTVHDGQPRDLFYFKIQGATDRHYTSAAESVSANLGIAATYVPIAGMRRSSIAFEPTGDSPDLEVTMPFDTALITDLLFTMAPREVRLIVYRTHGVAALKSNTAVIWDGYVGYVDVSGRVATLTVPSAMSLLLDGVVPKFTYQRMCNFVLGDSACTIDLSNAAYNTVTTVTAIGTEPSTVTLASLGGAADQTYRGGQIVRTTDGERRLIVDQSGLICRLNRPFRAMTVTDGVTAYVGCDHIRATCQSAKFSNNLANFGGHADIPNSDLFRAGALGTGVIG